MKNLCFFLLLALCGSASLQAQNLTVSLNYPVVYTTNNGACTTPHGRANYALWTAQARGGTGAYTYAWYYQPYGVSSFILDPSSTTNVYGICLNGYTNAVNVKVIVTSGSQTATAGYYCQPQPDVAPRASVAKQSDVTAYPNPANEYVEVATAESSLTPAILSSQARALSAQANSEASTPTRVTIYNAQGKAIYTTTSTDASVHVPTQAWPAGLYQVLTQQGETSTRHQLSVQH